MILAQLYKWNYSKLAILKARCFTGGEFDVLYLVVVVKEVQIVYRLFLVNCYLLHGNIKSETETDKDRSI